MRGVAIARIEASSKTGGIQSTALTASTLPLPNWLDVGLDAVLILALLSELAVLFADVAIRTFFGSSLLWGEEMAQLALAVLSFIGGAAAYSRGHHMAVQVLVRRLPPAWHRVMADAVDWLVVGVSLLVAVITVPVLGTRWEERTLVLGMRLTWFVLPLFLGMVLLTYFAALRLWQRRSRTALATGVGLLLLSVGLALARSLWGPWGQTYIMLWLTLVLFAALLLAGMPIGFVLALASLFYLYTSGIGSPYSVPINMQSVITSFILLAVPFFILAGYLMTEGGMSRPLSEFVRTLVGHLRGGLLQVIVVTMYIFSGISGAKVADVAAVGTAMGDLLRREGYEPAETVAVLAASAVMGETVPPSIAMLVLGSITTLSVGALFMAGLVPAVVMAICLMLLIYIRARLAGLQPTPCATWRERGRAGFRALPALFVPLILIGGILTGIATPTEISSFAVVYAVIVSWLLYRSFSLTGFHHILTETASVAGMILFIISAAGPFSWALTVANLPLRIAGLLGAMGGSRGFFLLASILTLIVMGALLEGLPSLLIFAPLLLPVAAEMGVDPLQYGIVLIFAMGVGAFAPPIGVGLYVACSVGGASMEETTPRIIPYMVVVLLGLLLVAFVPWFSLVVPHLLRLGG